MCDSLCRLMASPVSTAARRRTSSHHCTAHLRTYGVGTAAQHLRHAEVAIPSQMRKLSSVAEMQHRAVAQLGSALRSGRRGREFKSRQPDHETSPPGEVFCFRTPVRLRSRQRTAPRNSTQTGTQLHRSVPLGSRHPPTHPQTRPFPSRSAVSAYQPTRTRHYRADIRRSSAAARLSSSALSSGWTSLRNRMRSLRLSCFAGSGTKYRSYETKQRL